MTNDTMSLSASPRYLLTTSNHNSTRNNNVVITTVEPELHKLIRNKLFHLAMNRIELHPEEVRQVDSRTGDLPIILAVKSTATPLALIQTLLDLYPYQDVVKDLVREGKCCRRWSGQELVPWMTPPPDVASNAGGGPPLLLAVQNRLSPSIIRYLIQEAGLNGLRVEANSKCQLPLHVAAAADLQVVQLLTRTELLPSPLLAAAASPDQEGQLPLHCFVQARSKQASLELLLSAYPNALKHRDYEGRLPLHFALKHNASLVMIQFFVTAYPKSVRVTDRHGNLPIHYAFCEGARTFNLAKKLQALLQIFPESAMHKNNDGLTPSQLASRTRKRGFYSSMDYNVKPPIQEMLRTYPENGRRVKARPTLERHPSDSVPTRQPLLVSQPELEQGGDQQAGQNSQVAKPQEASSTSRPCSTDTCSVCRRGTLSHALVPCGHVVLCDECADLDFLIGLDGRCPAQKCPFFRAQRVIGNKEDESPCVICLEGVRNHAFVPCGHVSLCGECANDACLTKLEGTCPLGRCRIRSFLKIDWTRST